MTTPPHKSRWKDRKAKVEETPREGRVKVTELERREKLNKVKRNAKITAVLIFIPVISYLGAFLIPYLGFIAYFGPIFELIAVIIIVFYVYYPVSDMLKEPEK